MLRLYGNLMFILYMIPWRKMLPLTTPSLRCQKQEHTCYALTDKWILTQKLGIPKIQFTDHMKLKKKEDHRWILQSFLEGGTKYPWEELQSQSSEQRLNERPFRDCPAWASIPYTITKPRRYCGCQQVLAGRRME